MFSRDQYYRFLFPHFLARYHRSWVPALPVGLDCGNTGVGKVQAYEQICRFLVNSPELLKYPSYTKLLKYSNRDVENLFHRIDRNIAALANYNAKMISINDGIYPALLRQICAPPLVIFVRGNEKVLEDECVSIVGARKVASESVEASKALGRFLSEKYCIVSGGAIGCDVMSHRGVLAGKSRGRAIVVFAGGLSDLMPRTNKRDFEAILDAGGCLISEELVSYSVIKIDYLIRNRIIAGLSQKLFLIQAGQKSGAMNTALNALNEGREVLVFDICRDDVRFLGNQNLIDSGAEVFSQEDIYAISR